MSHHRGHDEGHVMLHQAADVVDVAAEPIACFSPDIIVSQRSRPHIGGVIPSRPTSATAASQVPSAFFAQAGMKIFAPGFGSAFSPGIKLTTTTSDGTTIVCSPSLCLSASVFPSCLLTCFVTAALVMLLPGIRSQG